MLPRKTLAVLTLAAAAFGSVPSAGAVEQSHGWNNGDNGFVNVVVESLSQRSSGDVSSMTGHCTFDKTIVPFSSDMVVVVVHKGAITPSDPVSHNVLGVVVRCTVKDYITGAVYYDAWAGESGYAAAGVGQFQGKDARLSVCTQVKALTNAGDVISQTFPCQDPTLLPS